MPRKNSIYVSVTLILAIALIAQMCIAQKAMCMESLRDATPDEPLLFFQLTGAASMINMDSNLWKQVAVFWPKTRAIFTFLIMSSMLW